MRLRIASLALLATSARIALGTPTEKHLAKRDTCTLTGWLSDQGDFGAGRKPDPGDVSSGFYLDYVGGVAIGSSTFENGGSNPIALNGPVTIPQEEIGSAESIMWWPDWNLFAFEGCRISYEGIEYEGYINGALDACAEQHALGESCSYCSVDFGCESNL